MRLCPRAPHASLATAQFASILVAFHDVPPAAIAPPIYPIPMRPNLQITTPTVNYTTYISDSQPQQLDPQCCHAFIWPTRKKIECPTPDNWYHNVAKSTEGSPKCKLYLKFRIRYVLSIGGCRSKQNDFWVCWPPWIEHVKCCLIGIKEHLCKSDLTVHTFRTASCCSTTHRKRCALLRRRSILYVIAFPIFPYLCLLRGFLLGVLRTCGYMPSLQVWWPN